MQYEEFTSQFDKSIEALGINDKIKEELFEQGAVPTLETVLAQVLINNLFPHELDPELHDNDPTEIMTTEQKVILMRVASHMGPDWVQGLYHAVVFMTKVA